MKILLQGLFGGGAFPIFFVDIVKNRKIFGHEVITIGLQKVNDIVIKSDKISVLEISKYLPWTPDVYLCQSPESHILPSELYRANFPIVATTCDYDFSLTTMLKILPIFDSVITYGGVAHQDMKKIGVKNVYTFPGWLGFLPLDNKNRLMPEFCGKLAMDETVTSMQYWLE